MKRRMEIEDTLKYLHERLYKGKTITLKGLSRALHVRKSQASRILKELENSNLIILRDKQPILTPSGQKYALHVVRAHRLYETYLWKETGFEEGELHRKAELKEHELSDDELEKMAQKLGDPRFDPHGDPIPTKGGEMPPLHGRPLRKCPIHWVGKIIHLEDEPETVFERIVNLGLSSEMRLRVVEKNGENVCVFIEGRIIELTSEEVRLVFVAPLEKGEQFDEKLERLSTLKKHEKAEIVGLSPGCHGQERNRLLDLGVVPGTKVGIELVNAGGSPIAYRLHEAVIALRKQQAERILIKKSVEI